MNDEDSTPVMYDHCMATYEKMKSTVEIVEVEGTRIAVWEGFLTRLIQSDLQLAVPYYSAIRGHLIRMGCIKQLRRGGGNSKSQWELIRPPSKELFDSAQATGNQRQRQKEAHTQQLSDLTRRVSQLEANEKNMLLLVNDLANTLRAHVGENTVHNQVA